MFVNPAPGQDQFGGPPEHECKWERNIASVVTQLLQELSIIEILNLKSGFNSRNPMLPDKQELFTLHM